MPKTTEKRKEITAYSPSVSPCVRFVAATLTVCTDWDAVVVDFKRFVTVGK